MSMKCGLLGERLGHSLSPEIHARLGNYEYRLYEVPPEEVEEFLLHGNYDVLNVTIPYKEKVIPFLDSLSPEDVNTNTMAMAMTWFRMK